MGLGAEGLVIYMVSAVWLGFELTESCDLGMAGILRIINTRFILFIT